MRVLLATNVLLVVLTDRQPWAENSADVLSLIEKGQIEGYLAADDITTLHYLLMQHLNRRQATTALPDILSLVSIATVDQEVLLKALSLGWADFEDAVQAVCAQNIQAAYLITRDPTGYESATVPIVSPTEFLALSQGASDKPARSSRRRRP